jgi:hypothetical protein
MADLHLFGLVLVSMLAGHAAGYLHARSRLPDERQTLDIQNHVGDSRPTWRDRVVARRRWAEWER